MYIYKTTNLFNNKIYIGQTMRKDNEDYLGSGTILKNAIKKYGRDNFKKEILQECFSKEELDIQEKYWIKELNSIRPNGYNICDGGQGGDVRRYMSDEELIDFGNKVKKGLKEKGIIKKGIPLSEKNKKGISNGLKKYYDSGGTNWLLGKEMSQEVKDKISKSNTGRIFSDEWKKNMKINHYDTNGKNNPMYGKSLYSVWLEKYGKEEADIRKQKWKDNLLLLQERKKQKKIENFNITKIIIDFINNYLEQNK